MMFNGGMGEKKMGCKLECCPWTLVGVVVDLWWDDVEGQDEQEGLRWESVRFMMDQYRC